MGVVMDLMWVEWAGRMSEIAFVAFVFYTVQLRYTSSIATSRTRTRTQDSLAIITRSGYVTSH